MISFHAALGLEPPSAFNTPRVIFTNQMTFSTWLMEQSDACRMASGSRAAGDGEPIESGMLGCMDVHTGMATA